MSGAADPLYVRARAALLDAVNALEAHLDSIVLVGAQAVYLHTGESDLAVAEYTTDADFTIEPREISDSPLIEEALTSQGLTPRQDPGGWLSRDGIYIDLMVPEELAGPGRRGADLGIHGRRAARRAKGLEGSLVDKRKMTITSLDVADSRSVEMWVAGPAALLVAKIHKIRERSATSDRLVDKDALDIFRLLRFVSLRELRDGFQELLQADVSREVTLQAISEIPTFFSQTSSVGVAMAMRAVGPNQDTESFALSLSILANELFDNISEP